MSCSRLLPPSILLTLSACAAPVMGPAPLGTSTEEGARDPMSQGAVASTDARPSFDEALVADELGFGGVQPFAGMRSRFTSEGLRARFGGSEVALATLSIGREGAPSPARGAMPIPGPSVASGPFAGSPTLFLTRDGALEWWVSRPDGAQVGWDLADNPGGEGLVEIDVAIDGADPSPGDDDGSVLLDLGDRDARFGGLSAWDDRGEALDAWMELSGGIVRVLVDDAGATWPIHIDPVLSSSSWTATGGSNYELGSAVASAGDVNGDGYTDLIVGAPGYFASKGRAYVYLGSASGLSARPSATLAGISVGDHFGAAVSGAGDVNGDGYDDVIVGAFNARSGDGAAYLFLGSASGVSTTASTSIVGASNSQLGHSVAGAGDVNGDGYDDVIIGADMTSSGRGSAYVHHGSASGLSSTPSTTVNGSGTDYLGYSVAGAGDVNGDGYDDVIIGSLLANSTKGSFSVHHGSSSGVSSTAARTVSGSNSNEHLGTRVAGVGDVNGDGYADIAASAPGYSSSTGRVVVYHGSRSGIGGSAATELTGSSSSGFGTGLGATDVDADGYDDLVVGSPDASSGVGAITIYLGSRKGISSSGTSVSGPSGEAGLGAAATGAGDFNGDGYGDIAGGAPDYLSGTGQALAWLGYADADGDGYIVGGEGSEDCDDTDASVYPGATEIVGDGIDQDCDGQELCYTDSDGDGYASSSTISSSNLDCDGFREASAADYARGEDCDDGDAAINPGATEVCDSADTDEDCNGVADDADAGTLASSMSTWYPDSDGDGYGSAAGAARACDAPAGHVADNTDCDDGDPNTWPGAVDLPGEGGDTDCDGIEYCYVDADGDGWASSATVAGSDEECAGAGLATAATFAAGEDCDDSNAAINPAATEVCDAADTDEDCNGVADDDDAGTSTASMTTWYPDMDGDGFGYAAGAVEACEQPAGFVADDTDCNDSDADAHPGAVEIPGEGGDSDCDGIELCYTDADSDGWASATTVATTDLECDGVGLATAATLALGEDCDDDASGVNPAATEVCDSARTDEDCNGVADDDDGGTSPSSRTTWYPDTDGDGFGSAAGAVEACEQPAGVVADGTDCDDTDADAHPGAVDLPGEGGDSDCDGVELCYTDADGDGWASSATVATTDVECTSAGLAAAATLARGEDCDDTDAAINPGATEIAGDGRDGDCDGEELCYADADGDGWVTTDTVAIAGEDCAAAGLGTLADREAGIDCDDDNGAINPGATEVPGDGVDSDCDGVEVCYVDNDGDGWAISTTVTTTDLECDGPGMAAAATLALGEDCDDEEASVNPGATEVCDPLATDENCNGLADDADPSVSADSLTTFYADFDDDGFGSDQYSRAACAADEGEVTEGGDCDDEEPAVNPDATEVCNGVDDDCDGVVDGGLAVDAITVYADEDGDGWGSEVGVMDCDLSEGFVTKSGDCDDGDAGAHPGAVESCNQVDDDCDGKVDEDACEGAEAASCSTAARASAGWVGAILGLFGLRRRR